MINYKTNSLVAKIEKDSISVVLFGAGNMGELAYHALKKRNVTVDYFCDSDKHQQGKLFYGIKIISPNELSLMDRNKAIFISNGQYVSAVSSLLDQMKFQLVYNLVDLLKNTDFSDCNLDQSMFSKLSIKRQISLHEQNYLKTKNKINNEFTISNVDIVITERCSLKCKDCANLMQYYVRPKNSDHDLLFKSVDKLMKCIDKLYEFRILGGDPFMNKKMYEVINKLVDYDNVDQVVIYTNVTILPKGENLECLKNKKVRLQISNYGAALSRKHDETIKLCEANNILYVTERVTKWQDLGKIKYEEKTVDKLENLFKNCCANNLLTLIHGKLHGCPTAANGTNLRIIPNNPKDIVDLSDDKMSIEETRTQLRDLYYNKKFLTACSYCKGRDYGFGEIDAAIQTKKPLPLPNIN